MNPENTPLSESENDLLKNQEVIASRKELKAVLRHGDLTRVAKLADVTLRTVWRWFENETDDINIKVAVDAIIARNESDFKERLNSL